jgi:hypothetical protein
MKGQLLCLLPHTYTSIVTGSGWGNETTYVPIIGLAGCEQAANLLLREGQQVGSTMEYAALQVITAANLVN